MRRMLLNGKMVGLLAILLVLLATVGNANEQYDEVFALIEGNTFTYMSGVGGWWTDIVVSSDGNFKGYFHDADMGDVGDNYPEGTLYECYFSGVFVVTEMIDQYTCELRLAALNIESETGVERIADGVRVINTDAYGIEGGDVFMLYFPGRETADLPEGFLEWICMPNAWEEAPDVLPFYGLYNVKESTGFFSASVENTFYEYDGLTGAWRTSEDDGVLITLLLYPNNAFRLYQYRKDEDETFMLEGVRIVEGDVIIVSDIRLGVLDTEGNYAQIGEKDTERFIFSLDFGDVPMLTLINEQGDTTTLYPVDLDGPG